MKKLLYAILITSVIILSVTCTEEDPYDYEIEYQDGYPNVLAGYWKAYDL